MDVLVITLQDRTISQSSCGLPPFEQARKRRRRQEAAEERSAEMSSHFLTIALADKQVGFPLLMRAEVYNLSCSA